MRLFRIALGTLAILLLAALAAAWLGPQMLDWDDYRAGVERIASAAAGRPVEIRGAIHLSLLPQATLTADGVSLTDTGDGASAAAGEIRLRISLTALLEGRIQPLDLILHQPVVQLPWPLRTLSLREGPAPGGLHATVEDGTLAIGGIAVTAIDGELHVDPATGTLSASGLATVFGRPWRMTGRLSPPGPDGASPIAFSLDGQGPGVGTGGALTGQIGADGGLAGQVTGRGPDLSLLLPAPPLPWHGDGRLVAMGGLVVADDLDVAIGGAPARGAVSLRLLPDMRLDAALTTSRLNLDAWLPPLLHGARTALPTGIDLSAEAASLGGGTLRHLRAGFDLAPDGVTLRQAEAMLPGDAPATLTGTLVAARFTGSGRITMPDVPQTLAWLRPFAPALLSAWPAGTVHRATAQGEVAISAGNLALTGLQADADGVAVTGDVTVKPGPRPSLAASLHLTGPVLDRVTPAAPASLPQAAAWLTGLSAGAAGFDADLDVSMAGPRWHGTVFDEGVLALGCQAGVLTARQVSLTGPAGSFTLAGVVTPGGSITRARIDASLAELEVLAPRLSPGWARLDGVLRGPGSVSMSLSGAPNALALAAAVDAGDARAQANGTLDLPGQRFAGSIGVLHPGAPRLLQALGLPGFAEWVGSGSLSLQGTMAVDGHGGSLTGFGLSAGLLRLSGDLALVQGRRVSINGQVRAESLPVILPMIRSAQPADLGWLDWADAKIAVQAGQVLWNGAPAGQPAQAAVTLADGTLALTDLRLPVAGGWFNGRLALAGSEAPQFTAAGTLTGAVLADGVFGTAVDLPAGMADLSFDLTAHGHSPAAILATLGGRFSATVRNGVLSGLDEAAMRSALLGYMPGSDPAALSTAVAQALRGGATPFDTLTAAGTAANGVATIDSASVQGPAGMMDAAGAIDLPDASAGLRITVRPSLPASDRPVPIATVRLTGAMAQSVDLAGLVPWLSAP